MYRIFVERELPDGAIHERCVLVTSRGKEDADKWYNYILDTHVEEVGVTWDYEDIQTAA